MGNLTMGSLFDGSGGFPLGALLSGIMPVWGSEIEPFCIRVTTKRFPQMKHYGDISKINGAEIEPVDIVTFGSPCTNMSVAGKREGLNGEQSVLFYQAIRVIKEMRCATNGEKPRFIVWENVPGAYSSAGGGDFREVLSEIVKIKDETLSVPLPEKSKWLPSGEIVGDGFSVAFRCIDAQFLGVAQRRRRCYLVADFDGECAGKILFESEGVSGYTPQGFGAGKGTASDAEGGVGAASLTVLNDQGGSNMDLSENITGTLRAEEHGHQPLVFEPGAVSRIGGHAWDDVTGALRADMGDNQLSVAIPINTQIATRHNALGEGTGFGVGEDGDPAFTLQAAHSHAVALFENHSQDTRYKGPLETAQTVSATYGMGGNNQPFVVENHLSDNRVKLDESGTVQTLTGRMGTGGGNVPLVASFMGGQGADAGSIAYSEEVAPTLRGQAGGNSVPMVMNERQFALTVGEDVANTLTGTDFKGTQCVFEPTPQTLKIRSGCEGGGKGALIQDDKSATLSCNNDQTVFVPTAFDGKQVTSKTNHSNPQPDNPCHTLASGNADSAIICYGICSDASNSMRSDNPNSGIYEADTSRTLDGNACNPSANQGGIAVIALQGSMIGREDKNGPQGSGVSKDVCFCLNTIDKHSVAYSLDRSCYNQGRNAQFDISIQEEQSQTLVAKGPNAVAYDCRNHASSEVSATLQAKNNGGQSLNYINPVAQAEPEYTVRRLVPQECALLQGFPPNWCANLETSEPTDADIAWWSEVFETHRKIMGTSEKPKSRNQIIKWLKDPHSDSAEYKMWGNGVALPCVRFVMAGIVWAVEKL